MRAKDDRPLRPGVRPMADPQAELVRRYARILRSAPAEAWEPRVPRVRSDGTLRSPRFARDGAAADLRTARPEL